MMIKINPENWNRKEHFEFFSKMDNPFFGLTSEVDCTKAYQYAKDNRISFFALYLHRSMVAANAVEAFKMRIIDDEVFLFDVIHAGTTIGRSDGTFAFSFIHFSKDFEIFNEEPQKEIHEVENSSGIRMEKNELGINHIRHTTIPWNSFSALVHPGNSKTKESIPKISFGKFSVREGKKFLPVSVEAHHGLADGLHIAQYLEEFQKQLDF